jgi:hypothetical protein
MSVTPLALKTAEIASHDVGIMEIPRGSNSGPRIDDYLAYTGLPLGRAYCASACSLWVHEAAVAINVTPVFLKSGSTLGLVHRNQSLKIDEVSADAIPCIGINVDSDGIHGHAFLIVGLDDDTGTLQTIDPNSNESGSREGIGVFALARRNLKDHNRLCYLRIA